MVPASTVAAPRAIPEVPAGPLAATADARATTTVAVEETPAAPAFTSERPSVERELSFGLEKPREGTLVRKLAVAAAVVLIVAGIGYASWSWDVRDSSGLIGRLPASPTRDLGIPATPGIPPAEEIDLVFTPRRFVPRAPVDEPQLVETPPEAAIPMAPDVVPTFPNQ
jgi:hypothetical protein